MDEAAGRVADADPEENITADITLVSGLNVNTHKRPNILFRWAGRGARGKGVRCTDDGAARGTE